MIIPARNQPMRRTTVIITSAMTRIPTEVSVDVVIPPDIVISSQREKR